MKEKLQKIFYKNKMTQLQKREMQQFIANKNIKINNILDCNNAIIYYYEETKKQEKI